MGLHAKIYHTERCMKCKVTSMQLGIPSEMILISRTKHINEDIISYMDQKGLTSAPLVQVFDENDQLADEWNDFNLNKIKKYQK